MRSEVSSLSVFISLIIFLFLELSSSTWNFSTVNLPDDVPIWRFAIWRKRAFLSVPSYASRKSTSDNDSEIALLEVGWPEPGNNYTSVAVTSSAVHVFPKTRKHVTDQCDRLLSVTGLDVDARGRLWILDSHNERDCPAKIIVYDLRRNDREISRTDLQGIAKRKLRSLVVDPIIGKSGPRAYIGDPGDETLITYSLSHRRWWKLRLNHGPEVPRVFSTEIAISRKSSLLYLTGTRSQDLFSFDLEQTRTDESPPQSPDEATQLYTVKWLGTKMGRSSGMVCDQKGGLHYFLVTEHASVRWDAKHDLKTSSYSILLQSDEVPCITDYRIDSQRNVWGLVNLEHPYARSSNTNLTNHWKANYRTVRVFKYNRFVPVRGKRPLINFHRSISTWYSDYYRELNNELDQLLKHDCVRISNVRKIFGTQSRLCNSGHEVAVLVPDLIRECDNTPNWSVILQNLESFTVDKSAKELQADIWDLINMS